MELPHPSSSMTNEANHETYYARLFASYSRYFYSHIQGEVSSNPQNSNTKETDNKVGIQWENYNDNSHSVFLSN